MKRYKSVDDYVENNAHWHEELVRLRDVLRTTPLTEEVKWGAPCYTYEGQNVVGIGGFKSYFGLWFHQGALLADEKNVLINAQEGTTRALRQWRMQSAKEIKSTVIKAYVRESIGLVEAGQKIGPERRKPVSVPPELLKAIAGNAKAKKAFAELTPGKQREYAEHIAGAKRDATKASRIAKILPMIAAGKGLNDKYR